MTVPAPLRRFVVCASFFAIPLSAPTLALADDERKSYDARLEGHTDTVMLEGGSTALTWLLLMGLGVLCAGVMFKNANRTHLD